MLLAMQCVSGCCLIERSECVRCDDNARKASPSTRLRLLQLQRLFSPSAATAPPKHSCSGCRQRPATATAPLRDLPREVGLDQDRLSQAQSRSHVCTRAGEQAGACELNPRALYRDSQKLVVHRLRVGCRSVVEVVGSRRSRIGLVTGIDNLDALKLARRVLYDVSLVLQVEKGRQRLARDGDNARKPTLLTCMRRWRRAREAKFSPALKELNDNRGTKRNRQA